MTDDGSAAPLSPSGLEAPPPSKAVLPLRKTGTDAYVELHARSAFSFLEGASLPEELIARCAELDQPAIALADAQGVYGAPRFHMASKTAGIRALIGAEVATPDGGRYTLLAENQRGYQNLCRLITRIQLREGRHGKPKYPVATENDFAEFADGLVCLTGGTEGPFARIFTEQHGPAAQESAQKQLERMTQLFTPRHLYVELQRHARRGQEAANRMLIELARGLRLPLLASNGVSHATCHFSYIRF